MNDLRYRTLEVAIARRVDPSAARLAMQRWHADQATSSVRELADRESAQSDDNSEHSTLWLIPPDRWRYETHLPAAADPYVQVVNGSDWALFNPLAKPPRATTGRDRPRRATVTEAPPFAAMWDLTLLDRMFERHYISQITYRGRHCSKERAHTHASAECEEAGPWPGASAHELLIDTERRIVLRWAAYVDTQPYGEIVVVSVSFDKELSSSLFDTASQALEG